ncbi:energy transducer TonB [candidate division WOR-3 bacterium]|nr:energy transducer TonB [candidate division WOR-3 bacterium]
MKKSTGVVDLKKSSKLYSRISLLLSLLFFIALFHLIPHYSLHPFVPRIEKPIEIEVDPEEIENVEELPPEIKPQLPIEAESEEEIQKATIEKTANFETFDKLPIQPKVDTPEFVAYDTPPRPKNIIKPKYPEIAKQAGIEGTVILKLLVDEDGKVLKVKVLKGLAKDLDEAAIKTAYATTFYPAKQRDKPVKVWVSMPIIFKLK